jgi:hypothetical protein
MKSPFIGLGVLVVLLHSCVSYTKVAQTMPEDMAEKIPLNAYKIIIQNDSNLNANYTKCYKALLSHDFIIENENKEMGYILATKKYGDTNFRIKVQCDNKSIAVTGDYKLGTKTANQTSYILSSTVTYDWEKSFWTKKADYPSAAFAKLVNFAMEMGGRIIYQ